MPTLKEIGHDLGMSKQGASKTVDRALEKLRDELAPKTVRKELDDLVIKDHPIAAVFPLIGEEELAALAGDIAARGLLDSIIMHDGMILDGRNRYRACLRCGVAPRFGSYDGDDPIGMVVSRNIHRRHLDVSQRAMIAAKLANMRSGERTDLGPSLNLGKVSQAEAAEKLKVSVASVEQAAIVKNLGAPELLAAVEGGDVSVSAAAKIARLPHEEQAAALAGGRQAVAAKAAELRERQRATHDGFKLDQETTVGQMIAVCRESGGRFEGFVPDGRTYRVQVEERFAVAA